MRASSVHGRRKWGGLVLLLVALLMALAWLPTPRAGDGQAPSDIVVTQLHFFVTRGEGTLQVIEYYLIGNTGKETYEGVEHPQTGERVTVSFTLPEGAEALRFDGPGLGERFVEVEGGFADTEPIPPGMATVEVLFTYRLPYREGMQVARVFEVPVMSAVLVVAEEGLVLEGRGLTPAGTLDTQVGPATSYTAGPLGAGESLTFSVLAGEHPAASAPVRGTVREMAIGLVALAVALAVVYLLWRSPAPGPCPAEARPLVKEIAALDTHFEAGQVEEEVYRQKRDDLKRRVREALARQCP
jgi:hypothetical protein